MTEGDPIATLREFREYFASSYGSLRNLAKQVGITNVTFRDLLSGNRQQTARTLAKLRNFLDAEAKRNRAGNGIKPTEPMPIRTIKTAALFTMRGFAPFCRKACGEIRPISRKQFQPICPKCGASGPKRGSHQDALRAWNREGMN